MNIFTKQSSNIVSSILKEKIHACDGEACMPMLRKDPVLFWLSPTGDGFETDKLPNYVLEWGHFDGIIKKANQLGGKMYRGDVIARSGGRLGEELSFDTIEGFIADEYLYAIQGSTVTRRSTYYSGILAWAGIVTVHRSQGQGSYITVNPKYRNI